MRRLFIDESNNTRDLGGYAVSNKRVKENMLIRSNLITYLSDQNIDYLEDNKIKTVIDLRNNEEITKKKSFFMNNCDFEYYHIKINGDGYIPKKPNLVLESYIEMLEGKEQIKDFFDILYKSKNGIIFYCNAGKDRTGVVTAIILKTLGVENKDIVVDYIASGIYLKEILFNYAKNNKELLQIIMPREETMYGLLEYIDKQYGSIFKYLKSCEIPEEVVNNIIEKYTC